MKNRRGFTLLEMFVAGLLLVALLMVCVEMLQATSGQHRAMRERQAAVEETANVMERLMARSYAGLTSEGVADVQLSVEMRRVLPEATLEILVAPQTGPIEGKRVTVLVHWPDGADRPDQTVRLVAWKYRAAAVEEKHP